MVNLPRLGASLVLAALVCGGCAFLTSAQNKVESVVEPLKEPTVEVLVCARYILKMARESGKELPKAAALAFCAAYEASPNLVVEQFGPSGGVS